MRGLRWAVLLGVAGCRVAATSAIAPELSDSDAGKGRDTSAIGTIVDPDPPLDSAVSMPVDASPSGALDAAPSMPAPCSSAQTCVAPSGCSTEEYGGHFYFVCSDSTTWDDARSRCVAAGTDLVIIDDAEENTFVASKIGGPSWLGLNDRDTEGDYRWVVPGMASASGAVATYTSWADAVPDNCGGGLFGQQDCVRLASDGTWNDSDCAGGCTEGTFAFVCESL